MAKFSTKKLGKQIDKWMSGYYTSGYKSKEKSYSQSSFWLDDDFLYNDKSLFDHEKKSVDYIKLAGYNRAIGNFVRIVTGKDNIPVKYSSGKQSYTDGHSVVISAKLDEKEFDSTVGLALHEGSHIALTDFKILNQLFHDHDFDRELDAWYDMHIGGYHDKYETRARIKALTNIIEDRRIDRFVYDSAPGYRGYYQALYDKYFNAKEIDNALLNGTKTTVEWESYEFHICNFANPNRQLSALPGLQDIWDMISLKTINRLKNTREVIDLAVEVWERIMLELKPVDNGSGNGNGNGGDEMQPGPDGGTEMPGTSDVNEDEENNEMGNGGAPNLDMQGQATSDKDSKKAQKEAAALEKAIQQQKDFLDGKIKKKGLSKSDAEKVNAAAEADMEYKSVGGEKEGSYYGNGGYTNCIVVHGIKSSLWDSDLLGGHCRNPEYKKEYIQKYGNKDYIEDGIALGKMLGKRLKTRDEERSLKTSRLDTGRIDRRLIAELGFGNDRVFARTIHSTVTPALIHISLDASGSMGGDKWEAAMKTAVAIAQAASMVSSLDCVISVRGSIRSGSSYAPLMWVIFDSRKEKLSAVKHKLYSVDDAGSTPEGLCYQAVMDEIIKSAAGREAYFINVCDGEPGYSDSAIQYGGDYAITHTAKQVQKMRNAGINVLSYFVSKDNYNIEKSQQKHSRMYGKSAAVIDLDNLAQLSKSLNELFERKNG